MSLFLSMLPIYLFGNLHCLGMCGPLVMMIGQHRYRLLYFLGRLLSFSLAGAIAGGIGAVSDVIFRQYHLTEFTSFFFGAILLFLGINTFVGWNIPLNKWFSKRLSSATNTLSILMLKDQPFSTFLFGFFTVALPCGQTLIVFSACALSGDALVGLFNGFAFALITSPSLFLAMSAHQLFLSAKRYYQTVIGVSAIFVAVLAFLRGFAEMGWISHWVLNPMASSEFHIVIY